MDVPPDLIPTENDFALEFYRFLTTQNISIVQEHVNHNNQSIINNNNQVVVNNNNNVPQNQESLNNSSNEELVWIPIINKTINPEAVWKCHGCGKSILVHPNYIKAKIYPCIFNGKCNKVEEVVKRMIELRGWTLIRLEILSKSYTVWFKCEKGHEVSLKLEALRKGSSCKNCTNNKKRKPSRAEKKVERPACDCKGTTGARPKKCKHWNHGVMYPESAKEWDDEANKPLKVTDIAPHCNEAYGFNCSNENCGEKYTQIVHHRAERGDRCPYCAGKKVTIERSLATTHPHIAAKWDHKKNGNLKSTDVTHSSNKKVWFICDDEKHKNEPDGVLHYPMIIANKTFRNSGCPSCTDPKYDQMQGGHEHFVKIVNEKHKGKYRYSEPYQKSDVKIGIDCPELSPDGSIHGIFRQTPTSHKDGKGCPKCAAEQQVSKKAAEINELLRELGYSEAVNLTKEWSDDGKLRNEKPLHVDNFLHPERFGLETDGMQHFRQAKFHKSKEIFLEALRRDMIKDKYFLENRLNLLRIPYNMSESKTREIIIEAIDLCRQGYHIYFSYAYYFEEIVKTTTIDHSKTMVRFIPCPPLKFKKEEESESESE